MTSGITHHKVAVPDVELHYVTAGEGEPLVLLHGWPQTWRAWSRLIPLLSGNFKIIAPDLRGLGDSSIPVGGYDKRTVAEDIYNLMTSVLGHQSFFLVGHDWGGAVAVSLALEHPEAVRRLGILDVSVPGDGSPNISQGGKRWHHAFHQTAALPEALTSGRESSYLGWFYDNYGAKPGVIRADERDLYGTPALARTVHTP